MKTIQFYSFEAVFCLTGLRHLLHLWLHPTVGLPVHVQPWRHHAWFHRSHSVFFQRQWLPARHRASPAHAPGLQRTNMQVRLHSTALYSELFFNVVLLNHMSRFFVFFSPDIRTTESLHGQAHHMSSQRSSGPFWQPALPLLLSFRFGTTFKYYFQNTHTQSLHMLSNRLVAHF